MSFVWKTSTLPKTNSWILKNDGLERVTPFEDGHCWYQFVRFLVFFDFGSTAVCGVWQYIPLIYQLYIANWVIICYLPPIKGTRKLH